MTMNRSDTVGNAPGRLVKPVHTRVAGRLRVEVRGLYRSSALKKRLEKTLGRLKGVRTLEISLRTGRVLVSNHS